MLSCRSHEDPHSCGTACDEKCIELFFLCPHTGVFQCLQSPLNNTLPARLQGKTSHSLGSGCPSSGHPLPLIGFL